MGCPWSVSKRFDFITLLKGRYCLFIFRTHLCLCTRSVSIWGVVWSNLIFLEFWRNPKHIHTVFYVCIFISCTVMLLRLAIPCDAVYLNLLQAAHRNQYCCFLWMWLNHNKTWGRMRSSISLYTWFQNSIQDTQLFKLILLPFVKDTT